MQVQAWTKIPKFGVGGSDTDADVLPWPIPSSPEVDVKAAALPGSANLRETDQPIATQA